jgi:hypothetical protein
VRMAGNARGEFRARQHNVDGHAGKSGAQAALEAIQWHAELLPTKHTK